MYVHMSTYFINTCSYAFTCSYVSCSYAFIVLLSAIIIVSYIATCCDCQEIH